MSVPGTLRIVAIPLLLGTAITLLLTVVAPWIEYASAIKGGIPTGPPSYGVRAGDQLRQVMISRLHTLDCWHSIAAGGVGRGVKVVEVPTVHRAIGEALVSPINGEMPTMIQVVASGWPMRAAMYIQWTIYPLPDSPDVRMRRGLVGNWRINRLPFSRKPYKLDVPLRPLWLGLIVNLAFWSTVSAILLSAFAALRSKARRRSRRRRGLCERCAYDLRGATSPRCPECGAESVAIQHGAA